MKGIKKHTEELLENAAEALQISPSKYEAAERSYTSIGKWLNRDNSRLKDADPQVYVQGSFRLGTVIKPHSGDDYDIDLVCELTLSKSSLTQHQLKDALGYELKEYAKAHGMTTPEEGRRCWTQNYADGAQFHLDTLPAIPDGEGMVQLLASKGLSSKWSESAIAITDRDHPNYKSITAYWPHSNPKGYSDWFKSRMTVIYEKRKKELAYALNASVEDIPDHKVCTPLQAAIQLLKHHRNTMFAERSDEKPISIILTTLAGHAYQQEPTISGALYNILQRMDDFIEIRNGVSRISNPTDPAENFADRWQQYPERKDAFYEWLAQAREDFYNAATALNEESAVNTLTPRLGKPLIEASLSKSNKNHGDIHQHFNKQLALSPPHKQTPPWRTAAQGHIQITKATYRKNKDGPYRFDSSGKALPKNCNLRFEAVTDVLPPYKVHWQVVNTGSEAQLAFGLRGGFSRECDSLTRQESTSYKGIHSIECFIVKNGVLAARSGQFIVNIQ